MKSRGHTCGLITILSKAPTIFKSFNRFPSNPFFKLSIHSLSAPETYAYNLKIRALVHGGKIKSARELFDQMPHRDIVTWNTMAAAYWQHNDMGESKKLFDSMPERNVVSWNSMIAGYLENGELDEAFKYFRNMPSRNIASWNAMISGLVRYDRVGEAERLFDEMPKRNVISYTAMVDGFCRKGEIDKARSLFDRIPVKNDVSWASMISGYVENRKFDQAKTLFDRMPEKNLVAFTAMITGYCKEGKVVDARNLFEQIQHKDLVAWNAMIAGYAHNEHGEEALKLHSKMQELGTKPDHLTLVVVLTACSILASLHHGRLTHAIAVKTSFLSYITLRNALITMYSKCGSIWESDLIFEKIQVPDLVSWNTIIAAYAQHGRYQEALAKFYDLLANGLKPDGITFLSIFSACGHVGMVKESLIWFNLMISVYGISPRAEHFSCLVDILSRAGQLERACTLISEMPFKADGSVWGSLLRACRLHLNIELAEIAARKLIELDSQSSGAYVMLSNIYAAADMWPEVTKMRGLMKENGVQKQPGFSWVEIGENTHLFMGGDVSHPDIRRIHSEVERIDLHMKLSNGITTENLD